MFTSIMICPARSYQGKQAGIHCRTSTDFQINCLPGELIVLFKLIVYDNNNGGLAARAWWLLRWLGHKKIAVLDGGWTAWENGNNPVETEVISKGPKTFSPIEQPNYIADVDYVELIRQDSDYLLVDSRSSERYWGINETTDPVAGHIPGAMTAPYEGNLDEKRILPEN